MLAVEVIHVLFYKNVTHATIEVAGLGIFYF